MKITTESCGLGSQEWTIDDVPSRAWKRALLRRVEKLEATSRGYTTIGGVRIDLKAWKDDDMDDAVESFPAYIGDNGRLACVLFDVSYELAADAIALADDLAHWSDPAEFEAFAIARSDVKAPFRAVAGFCELCQSRKES